MIRYLFHATIYGNLPRKSNNRQIVYREGKPISIKSKDALAYVESCCVQLNTIMNAHRSQTPPNIGGHIQPLGLSRIFPLQGSLGMTLTIYYDNAQADLSDELFADCLQRCGVISNDRQLEVKLLVREIDRKRPRVECRLTRREDIPHYE